MAKLIIQTGKLAGKRLTIPAKEVTIGRDEDCYIRMGSSDVSRHHCTVRLTQDGIQVTDLGSSNGTFVNDVAITRPTLLKSGDRLRVGPGLFEVEGIKPKNFNEDSISEWLTDGDSKAGLSSDDDTKIISNRASEEPPLPPAPIIKAKVKRVFKSVAEEAQYVIALWKEKQAAEEAE